MFNNKYLPYIVMCFIDVIFFIIIGNTQENIANNHAYFSLLAFLFIALNLFFGFYSRYSRGRSLFAVMLFGHTMSFVVFSITIQTFIFYDLITTRTETIFFSLTLLVYLIFRRVARKLTYRPQKRDFYIIKNDNTDSLEKSLKKEITNNKYIQYQGLCTAHDMFDITEENDQSMAIIGNLNDYTDEEQKTILNMKIKGCHIYTYADFFEKFYSKILVGNISDEWIVLSKGFDSIFQDRYLRLKKLFDMSVSLFGLILASPLLIMAAIMIKLDSKGPIIFSQERTGLNMKTFTIYKLRTMRSDAESGKAVWATKNDSRITKIGSFLRKTRIDEIPQLINVLKGDMSFIGPRPERPQFDEELAEQIPYYSTRYVIKPGLTGWAQVNYGYGASVEDSKIKLMYDLYYIKNYSFLFDCKIVVNTLFVVLFGRGR